MVIQPNNFSHWFVMLDNESLVALGQHEDYSSADEELERRSIGNSLWLFTDNSLRTLRDAASTVLADNNSLHVLRNAGNCVVVFNPDELCGANPIHVGDRLVELGWDVIDALATKPAENLED